MSNDWEDVNDKVNSFGPDQIKATSYHFGAGKLFQKQLSEGKLPQIKICNIPFGCDARAVERECEECGPVECFKFIPGEDENETAHAFVTFKSVIIAATALDHLNSVIFGSTKLHAKPARSKAFRKEEEAKSREENELLRSCGYSHVRDFGATKYCNFCGRDDKVSKVGDIAFGLQNCSGCKGNVSYCSQACQSKDWQQHKHGCDYFLKKRAAKVKAEKVSKTIFKKLERNDSSGLVWNVTHSSSRSINENADQNSQSICLPVDSEVSAELSGLLAVVPVEQDDPLDYHLLNTYIDQFVDDKKLLNIIEHLTEGELVLAKSYMDEAYRRAIVVKYDNQIGHADLWFIDVPELQIGADFKNFIPIGDFWSSLHEIRKLPFNESLKVKHFVDLPARLIPSYLHSFDDATGQSLQLRPYSDNGLTCHWSSEATYVLARIGAQPLDVSVKGQYKYGPMLIWGIQVSKELDDFYMDLGSMFVDEGWCIFKGDDEED